jgi:BolA protein
MTAEEIQKRLEEKINVEFIQVEDDSVRHQKHKQSLGKGGHYNLLIVSDDFDGLNLVARHRKIYELLNMGSVQIHALSISALTKKEWKEKNVHSS